MLFTSLHHPLPPSHVVEMEASPSRCSSMPLSSAAACWQPISCSPEPSTRQMERTVYSSLAALTNMSATP